MSTTEPPAAAAAAIDPAAVLRSRRFVALLVLAAVIGVVISFLAWAFLELITRMQDAVFTNLPSGLGFDSTPTWWPLPVLVLAGFPVAFAVARLPGAGGHVPAEGLKMSTTTPAMLPGILLAALGSLGLGLVLGPEAPLIALGGGFTLLLVTQLKKDTPQQALLVLGAAGSFAAISMIFQSPMIAAVLVIEATGLGGPTLPVILLPGLLAAGVGSLTFIGISTWGALDTSAYSLGPLPLPAMSTPTWGEVVWSVVLGVLGAAIVFVVRRVGLRTAHLAKPRPFVVLPAVGAIVALVAIVFDLTTSHGFNEVLFSGQEALPGLVSQAGTWSVGALLMVLLCKGLAWSLSMGSFRGGPTFPALYLGTAGGILVSHLPGITLTAGVAVGMAVMATAMLRLPLSSVILASALTASAGVGTAPLIIVGTVTAYLVTVWLDRPAPAPGAPAAAAPSPA